MTSVIGANNLIVYVPPVLFSIVALGFLLLWHLKMTTSLHFSLGFAQTALGFVLSTFSIEPSFDAFSSGMVFIGAAYCYGGGLMLHFGAPQLIVERRIFVAIYALLLTYLVFVSESLIHQLFLTDIGFAMLLAISVCVVARRASRPVDVALIITTIIVVLDSVARTTFFTFFTSSSDEFGDFADSAYNLAVHLSTITVCMLFPVTALGAIASAAIETQRAAAETDPLTGLLNRRGFDQTVALAKSSGPPRGTVIACDIDHFKTVNDRYGHAAGDRVIQGLADEIRRVAGADAHAARFGGEEFVIFLPDASLQSASRIAQQLRIAFAAREWTEAGVKGAVTVSCGVAKTQAGEVSLDSAIDRADRSLYAAKAAGRNRVMAEGGAPADGDSAHLRLLKA